MLDVAVVGAGPAGLLAAKTAAQRGLKVALVERRRSVSPVTRACCQQLVMDPGYAGDTVQVFEGGIFFERGGFGVPYSGPLFDVTRKYYISPGGRRICFAHDDGRPLAVQFDKGRLLEDLWRSCERAGVELLPGVTAWDAADDGESVCVKLASGSRRFDLQARKLLLADGVNSRMAEALGLNRGRQHFVTTQVLVYLLEGVDDPGPPAIKSFYGNIYQARAPIMLYPYFDEPGRSRLCMPASKGRLPGQVYEYAKDKGALAPYLKNARIVTTWGCGLKACSPMAVPRCGNCLALGDAAALVEVETQGALLCGFYGGNAALLELEGRNGFDQYTLWWQRAFEFNGPDAMRIAQGYALMPAYSDDELDYLFGLVDGQLLPGSYSQYHSPRYMWDAILGHRERLEAERPGLLQKIDAGLQRTLGDTL